MNYKGPPSLPSPNYSSPSPRQVDHSPYSNSIGVSSILCWHINRLSVRSSSCLAYLPKTRRRGLSLCSQRPSSPMAVKCSSANTLQLIYPFHCCWALGSFPTKASAMNNRVPVFWGTQSPWPGDTGWEWSCGPSSCAHTASFHTGCQIPLPPEVCEFPSLYILTDTECHWELPFY